MNLFVDITVSFFIVIGVIYIISGLIIIVECSNNKEICEREYLLECWLFSPAIVFAYGFSGIVKICRICKRKKNGQRPLQNEHVAGVKTQQNEQNSYEI